MGFVCVAELFQDWSQRVEVLLDRLRRLLGFARKRERLFVGVRHHGPVRGISTSGELNQQVRCALARLEPLLETRY